MTEPIPSQEVIDELLGRLLMFLGKTMPNNPQLQAVLTDLFPVLAAYVKQEGPLAAESLFEGLASPDPRPYWVQLVNSASVQDTVTILDSTRQMVIAATLAKIAREKMQWELAKAALSFALSLLPLLL